MNPVARILLVASNLWFLSEGLLGPLVAVFADRVGGDILDISWAWAIFLIVSGVSTVYVGRISDKQFSKEKLMIAGYALYTLGSFAYIWVSSPMQLFLVESVLGLATALAGPTWYSLFSKYETKASSGKEWGLVTGQGKIATAFAMMAGGFIVTYFSFVHLFIVMGVVQGVATIYLLKILEKKK
jgi:MFS family permease